MQQQLGRYLIKELLGEGSFARVYRAMDMELERPVALKVLKPAWLTDPQALARFKQEAKTMARLHHPHIAIVYEVGEVRGQVYLAQFLVEGETLAARLAQGRLTWGQMLNVLRPVASALDYAHRENMVHRDVKPSNILLDQAGRAYLGDFGLVRAAERSVALSTSVGGMIGTPPYMAPELWEDEPATVVTDVYALSCVVVEMLTGQVLFGSSTSAGVMRQHLINGPEFPEEWPADVPPNVAQVLQQGLAKEPSERIRWAGELAARLEKLAEPVQVLMADISEASPSASPAPPAEPLVLWLVSSAGQNYELKPGRLTMGWATSCDIKVVDPLASRQNTVLEFDGQRCTVRDQGSNNGTFINGQRLGAGSYPLNVGDQLTIGQTHFLLSQTAPPVRSIEKPPTHNGDGHPMPGLPPTLPMTDPVETEEMYPTRVESAPRSAAAPSWPLSPPPAAPASAKSISPPAPPVPAQPRSSAGSKVAIIVALAAGGLALLAIVCAMVAMIGGSDDATVRVTPIQATPIVEVIVPPAATPTPVDLEAAIESYLDSGFAHYDQGDYEQALADFTQAAELDPNSDFAILGRGYVYLAQGSYEQALTEFGRAIELEPDWAFAYMGRGDVFAAQSNYEQALIEYSKSIQLDPQNALAVGKRGDIYAFTGDYRQALADFKQAIELDPDDPSASGWRGFVDVVNEDYEQAIAHFDDAIERYPYWAFAYVWRGEAHRLLGDSGKAFADFNRAIELEPELAFTYASRGYLYTAQKDYERALTDFNQAVALEPDNAFAYIGRGDVYTLKGDYNQAITQLNTAIELNPNFALAYSTRGNVYAQMGDYELAFADYIKADELDPGNATYYNQVCWFGSLVGLAADVISICDNAVELASDEDRPFYRDSRGVARALTGDYAGAIDDFKSLIEWSKLNGEYQDYGPLREAWVAALQAGQNPFDEATLEELRKGIKK